MEGILSKYGGRSEEGRMSTAVWNVLMTVRIALLLLLKPASPIFM